MKIENRKLAVWLASAAAILVCLFGNLGAIGLVGPDEPRYAWIARAMAETGDWVTPRLYGQPWFEKPILYYWGAAAGFVLHLPAEWAARLPSAIAMLIAALAIGWLASKTYSRDFRSISSPVLLAPLVFSTSVAAIGFSRSASPDALFTASLTLAMASAASALQRGNQLRNLFPAQQDPSASDRVALLLFGAFLGLGVLAKGPAAIVLAAGSIGIWALATRKWRIAYRLAHPLAIGAFCVVALPWYIVCALRNPDFLRTFLFTHNVERYLTPMFEHVQPFWFFLPIVLLAMLPWTTLFWPAAQEAARLWRENSWRDSPGLFLSCWVIFPILFFSFSKSKLPGYALPSIPPLALLCAVAASRALDRQRFRTQLIFAALGIVWLPLGIAAWHQTSRVAVPIGENTWAVAGPAVFALALIVAVACIVLAVRQKPEAVLALSLIATTVLVEAINLAALPSLDPLYSARFHAAFMRNDQHPDRILTYDLARKWNFGLAFYFRRELPEWSPADPEAALVLTTPAGFADIKKRGRFSGELDEAPSGIVYVPVQREPR